MDGSLFHTRRKYDTTKDTINQIVMTEKYPRALLSKLDIAMKDTPVVLVNGPRQSGKTTLAQLYAPSIPYYSLDDDNLLNAALHDPMGFVERIDKAIIGC